MDNVIKNAVDYVKRVFENDFSGHDYFHTLRVYKTATRLAESEGANVHLAQLGALLHDVDDVKLSPQTCSNKDNARAFLVQNGVSALEGILSRHFSMYRKIRYRCLRVLLKLSHFDITQ